MDLDASLKALAPGPGTVTSRTPPTEPSFAAKPEASPDHALGGPLVCSNRKAAPDPGPFLGSTLRHCCFSEKPQRPAEPVPRGQQTCPRAGTVEGGHARGSGTLSRGNRGSEGRRERGPASCHGPLARPGWEASAPAVLAGAWCSAEWCSQTAPGRHTHPTAGDWPLTPAWERP